MGSKNANEEAVDQYKKSAGFKPKWCSNIKVSQLSLYKQTHQVNMNTERVSLLEHTSEKLANLKEPSSILCDVIPPHLFYVIPHHLFCDNSLIYFK